MPRGSLLLRPGRVTVTIGQPVSTEGLAADDRNDLLERVHRQIAEMLEESRQPSAVSPAPSNTGPALPAIPPKPTAGS